MKKITLTVACLFLFMPGSSFVMAADSDATKGKVPLPHLGVEAGITFSNLYGDVAHDMFGSRLGIAGGAFLNLPLGTVLALQTEVLYEQKGGKFNGIFYQLDYVEIPLLLNVTFGTPAFNPGLLLGPAIGDIIASQGVPMTIDHFDVGLVAGLQMNLSQFIVSGRYEMGVMELSVDQKVKNSTVTFLVGLSYI